MKDAYMLYSKKAWHLIKKKHRILFECKWAKSIDSNNQNAIEYLPFQFETEIRLVKRDKYTKIKLQKALIRYIFVIFAEKSTETCYESKTRALIGEGR